MDWARDPSRAKRVGVPHAPGACEWILTPVRFFSSTKWVSLKNFTFL